MARDSFHARDRLSVDGRAYEIFRLSALGKQAERLPYALKILLENLLRNEDGVSVRAADVEALGAWEPRATPSREIAFSPARVLLQDFTGVPAIVDLAAMRDAMARIGGDPARINPLIPVELVIDHSIVAEVAGRPDAATVNAQIEFQRNQERYLFLRWGQRAFQGLRVVPPNTGIVHQVNLEHLARVIFPGENGQAYPDTLVGTDSHTPMVNGLGVLGWGVGGIEAEAAMLGQPVSMLIPQVVGFKLAGKLREGATATDLVLTITHMLRKHGVVGKFVEFYGPGVGALPLADRATIGNMAPEYGSTCSIFPIDEETLRYLEFTGRPREQVRLVEVYAKAQGLFHDPRREPDYTERLELDLGAVEPCIAGPTRPQDHVPLRHAKTRFREALSAMLPSAKEKNERRPLFNVLPGSPEDASAGSFPASDPIEASESMSASGQPDPHPEPPGDKRAQAGGSGSISPPAHEPGRGVPVRLASGKEVAIDHGHVVIAAITSCTNTSNPSVMIAAGLLARNAVARGLEVPAWVKTSLAPGSRVVTDYYLRSGLMEPLEKLGFHLVGYGCTTCIGNSGPLAPEISRAIDEHDLVVAAVLSGNRNFEGRINPDCRMNFLASPPLVVAYALAGSLDVDLYEEPLGQGKGGPVYLADIWPSAREVAEVIAQGLRPEMFHAAYGEVYQGDERWRALAVPGGDNYAWDAGSTYIRHPTFFDELPPEPAPLTDIRGARVLALLGDMVTTDHISPAGTIKPKSPAGQWLLEHGVTPENFNSYGSRRGNHEVMIRGTFANIRLKNRLAPGTEGGVTVHLPTGDPMTIYEAAMRYQAERVPLVVLAGKEYGAGSSRDWAAKGTRMLGVRAVIAESYERIHRSNLIGMGVLPLQFPDGQSVATLGLSGHEVFDIPVPAGEEIEVRAGSRSFPARVRIDTPKEWEYFRHGGILQYVLRQLR